MKLRYRLALAFVVASTVTLVAARLATLASFNRIQQYELDEGLRARARSEANEFALVGRRALDADYEQQSDSDPLEELTTYGALYRADGTVAADTASFAHAPPLHELGIDPARVGACFDFRFRGKPLRGVLTEVKSDTPGEPRFLLVAASRRDMDADASRLLAVGWWVLLACIPVTMAVGWWFGRRMTLGIEELATVSRRVAAGELDAPVLSAPSGGEEVVALGDALREMVSRMKERIETERRFASNAAHELRSPLAALRGELELSLRRERTKAEYEATLREALADTNRLIDLSEDLLVVARLGAVTADVMEELDALELARAAVELALGGEHGEAQIEVTGTSARVRGVRTRLVRMVRNLVDNAVRHGATHVRVHISASRAEGDEAEEVRVAVEDDGPGIADADPERIFEPFYRGEQARQDSGAGLGLGIAREIARRHGGDVTVDSARAPTRFVVTLPAL
ncbi:MAG: HAMP domain-containing histidine kinase [Myxococcales bacterium]|nr:HAMP domain-containing histidine kinase [Myxococcales bacterium]